MATMAAGGFLFWLTLPVGMGATPDSANYLAAARAFADRGELFILGGRPLVWWPPLFPVAWGSLQTLGMEAFSAALILNLTCLLAFAWAWFLICRSGLGGFWWPAWVFIVASYGNLHLFLHATSEPGFLALCAWAVWFLLRFESQGQIRQLIPAASLAGLACLWRYPGATLILAGAVFLWIRCADLPAKLKSLGIWLSLSTTPLAAWFLRNWLVAEALTGSRSLTPHSWWTNLKASTVAILRWLLNGPHLSRSTVGWIAISALALMAILIYRQRRKILARYGKSQNGDTHLLGLFIASYGFSSWFLASISFTSFPNARLVSPIMAPLIFLIFKCLGFFSFPQLKNHGWGKAWRVMATVGYAIYVIFGAARLRDERSRGWGIQTKAWQDSPLIHAIDGLPTEAKIFTNFRAELYIHTNRDQPGLPAELHSLGRLRQTKASNGVYLAWSTIPKAKRKKYDLHSLLQNTHPNLVWSFEDGWLIYLPSETTIQVPKN